jgi:hypothetical protein
MLVYLVLSRGVLMRKTIFQPPFIATCVLALILLAAGVSAAQSDTSEVLVIVNGEAFTRTELAERELWNYRQHVSGPFPKTIVDIVTIMVGVQRGRKLGFAMTDQLFQDLIVAQMKFNHLDTEAQWRAAFTQERLGPMAEFRREKERELILQRLERTEIIDKVSITDDEAREYYNQRNNGRGVAPSEQELAEIKAHAITATRQQAFDKYLAVLRSEAVLEWPIPSVKRAYDEGLAQMAAQPVK